MLQMQLFCSAHISGTVPGRSGQEVFLFYEDEPTAWLQQHSELYVGLWWSLPSIIGAVLHCTI